MKRIAVLVAFSVFFVPVMVFAHPGGTDDAGGHHDYNNASGLGDYHCHHGYGPHLHDGGVCPYDEALEPVTETYEDTTYDYSNDAAYDYNYASDETYTFTEDELHDYVHECVDGDPAAYNMVRIEEYEDLQRDYETLESYSTDTEDAVNDTLTGVGVTAAIGIAACYYIYRRYSGEYKRGYDTGYKEGSTPRERLIAAEIRLSEKEEELSAREIALSRFLDDDAFETHDVQSPSRYIYCGIRFHNSGKVYHYRTNDENIRVGDTVVVPVGINKEETTVTVVSVDYYDKNNAPYPPEKTRFIIRKV